MFWSMLSKQQWDEKGKGMILFVILLHWWDGLECTAGQFQWNDQWCLGLYTIGRLVKIKQFVGSEVINVARFNNAFYYFGYYKEVRDWAIVRELINSVKLTRGDREFDNVSDCGDNLVQMCIPWEAKWGWDRKQIAC